MSQKSARRLRRERTGLRGERGWLTTLDEYVDTAVHAFAGPAIPGTPTAADLDALKAVPIQVTRIGQAIPRYRDAP